MQAATSLKSLSISSRLSLGFGCMLVLLVAVAAVGQLSVGKVHEQMRQITGIGANKAKLVNGMLESVSAIGIQSRSAAMLNDIDPKQAREQIDAVAKTLKLSEQGSTDVDLVEALSEKGWLVRLESDGAIVANPPAAVASGQGKDQGTAVLVVTSDLPEAIRISDRLQVVRAGTTTVEFGPGATQVDVLAAAAGQTDPEPEKEAK